MTPAEAAIALARWREMAPAVHAAIAAREAKWAAIRAAEDRRRASDQRRAAVLLSVRRRRLRHRSR